MTIERLKSDMILALKNRDKFRKQVLAGMIDSIQKAAIDRKTRDNITEDLVDEILLKVQKSFGEMIETCPANRTDKLNEYRAQLEIVNEYAPQLITDEAEIENLIVSILKKSGIDISSNKGIVMKTVMPSLKGKCDMKTANKVMGKLIK